jgi:hypothetical protein
VEKESDGGLGAHGVGSGTTGGGATGGGGVSGGTERKGEREIREEGARGKKRSRNTGERERPPGRKEREVERERNRSTITHHKHHQAQKTEFTEQGLGSGQKLTQEKAPAHGPTLATMGRLGGLRASMGSRS